jgi:RND superfamily putative drug exporter
MTDPFARLGRLMAEFRWAVVVLWVIVLVAGGLLALRVPRALQTGGFLVPNSESTAAAASIDREFGAANRNNLVIVFRSPTRSVDDADFKAEVVGATDWLAALPGVRQVDSYYRSDVSALVSRDRHSTIALVTLDGNEREVEQRVAAVRQALGGVTLEHYVTGQPASNVDVRMISEEDLRRAEFITLPIAAILLLLVFRTLIAAAIPLVLGVSSVVVALAVMYLLTFQTDISIFALNTASMIGLGLGIDFSLIMVNRFQEELEAGRSPAEAVAMTVATAGRSITYSSVTVMLGMLVLTLLFDLLVVRSMSLAVMLVAGTSLLAGLTLLPAVLAILGPRIGWLRVVPRRGAPTPERAGTWYRLSHTIMRQPLTFLTAGLGFLLVLAIPVFDIALMGVAPGSLPHEAESSRGYAAVAESFGPNRLEPIQIVMSTRQENGVWTPAFLTALQRLSANIAADPRADQVLSLSTAAQTAGVPPTLFPMLTPDVISADPARSAQIARLVNLDRGSTAATITVFVKSSAFDADHQNFVRDLREYLIPELPELDAYTVQVGGLAAGVNDYADALYGRFPLLVALVMAMTFVILMMFFRSILLPLKAILLNLAAVLATYGVLAVIFQGGWGAGLLGFQPQGALFVVTPALLFVILFSLSTDYEVFLLSRVREYFQRTGDNDEAVALGLQHTAPVITAAGLVLVGTFASFGASRIIFLKELGIGLAIGVLLDTTVVRLILVPATMKLMGQWNWWLPGFLERLLPELSEGPAPQAGPTAAAPLAGGSPPAPITGQERPSAVGGGPV